MIQLGAFLFLERLILLAPVSVGRVFFMLFLLQSHHVYCTRVPLAKFFLCGFGMLLWSKKKKELLMFNEVMAKYNAFPNSVKNGVLFLFTGWIWHYMTLYTNFLKGEIPPRQLIIGVCMCFLVVMMTKKRGWARWLCMLSNAFIVLQYLVPTYVFFVSGKLRLGMFSTVTMLLFSASTYYFAIAESSVFFKKDKPDEDSSDKKTVQNQN
ncbi:MAG: hypothetical protein DRI57_29075 [Deltaproteobacteria bacterium]|nr:MAG: hypothetical protein DRI57_29075 [Deltaproteobacteria bacterium]